MIYFALDELLTKTGSIYKLSLLASRRANELNVGATRLIDGSVATKPTTVALEEIRQGKISYKVIPSKKE